MQSPFYEDSEDFCLCGSVWLSLLGTCIPRCLRSVSQGEPDTGMQAHRTDGAGVEVEGSQEKSLRDTDRAGAGAK